LSGRVSKYGSTYLAQQRVERTDIAELGPLDQPVQLIGCVTGRRRRGRPGLTLRHTPHP
jgi:hypothetical protein